MVDMWDCSARQACSTASVAKEKPGISRIGNRSRTIDRTRRKKMGAIVIREKERFSNELTVVFSSGITAIFEMNPLGVWHWNSAQPKNLQAKEGENAKTLTSALVFSNSPGV